MRVCTFFFFSSRRRHTRLQGDWSSDVCSSDLGSRVGNRATDRPPAGRMRSSKGSPEALVTSIIAKCAVSRSEERRVGKGVDLGGRRIIKKKKPRTRRAAFDEQQAHAHLAHRR